MPPSRRGLPIFVGIVVGALAGGGPAAVGCLSYFIATGSGGPNGLGIAAVLSGGAGLLGAVVGGLLGGWIADKLARPPGPPGTGAR